MAANGNFDRRKKELLEKIETMRRPAQPAVPRVAENTVVVYAQQSPFIEGLVATIRKKRPVVELGDVEEACALCISHPDLTISLISPFL